MGWRTSRLGHWKIPLMGDGGDIAGAHSSNGGNGNSQDRRANGVGRFGNMEMNHSRPNESTRDVDIFIPRVVRVVRTIRIGLSRSANAWRPLIDTSTTKSKKSSFRIGAFAIKSPDRRDAGSGADRTNWFRLHFCTADWVAALLNLNSFRQSAVAHGAGQG
jgi:hypothetical protein